MPDARCLAFDADLCVPDAWHSISHAAASDEAGPSLTAAHGDAIFPTLLATRTAQASMGAIWMTPCSMTPSILLLLAGVVLAWFGGTLFVDGAVGLARWARWPVPVIGVTVAAFGRAAGAAAHLTAAAHQSAR